MHSYSFEGIVLKRSNFREADKIITLFTPNLGKVTFIAKGVRKISSKRSGSLELFNLIKATAVKGKGGIDVITEVQAINAFGSWKNYLGRSVIAYQLCETVDKLTPDRQPAPGVYKILSSAFSQIGILGKDWENNLHAWIVGIISELGYWPHDKPFTGDINLFVEDLAQRKMYSHSFLNKLK